MEDDGAQSKRKEILMEAQIKEIERKTIDNIRDEIAIVKSTREFYKPNEYGHFPISSINLIYLLYSSFFALKNAPLDKNIILRRKISNVLLELKAVSVICEIYKYYTRHAWRRHEIEGVQRVELIKSKTFIKSTLVLLNYTDASDELAVYIANYPGLLESIKQFLVERMGEHLSNEQGPNGARVTKYTVSLAHNISMRDATIPRLRDLYFTSAIQPFLHSPKEMIQLNALATLASIVNEKESEVINANQGTVKILLKCLEEGWKSKLRRYNGWSCKECALTICILARNDANKNMLAKLGAVNLLVKVGQTGDEEEKYEVVFALWTLAFDPEIRTNMVARNYVGLVKLLRDIQLQCKLPTLRHACGATLWLIQGEIKASANIKDPQLGHHIQEVTSEEKEDRRRRSMKTEEQERTRRKMEGTIPEDKAPFNIMISYQWGHQQILIRIRDRLQDEGFNVWMDIDKMTGSMLQSMANGVESSTIFLMAMSKMYKDSPNYRLEAECASTKNKKIIPLMMDRGYKPDGWLGIILGAKLFFEFSGKYEFEDKIAGLIKEINTFKHEHEGR